MANTLLDARNAVRQGLPFSVFESVATQLDMAPQQMTQVLGIPLRTLARRKTEHRFTPQESDRLYRLTRAVELATEVLGDADKARRWLKAPNRALGGEVPFDLLDTDIGAHQIEDVLVRLNHGIFS
ncbi:type II RES/Xre toxin-antitoxin system antitoxin [Sphaerotilus sp.]|jgi:putative toxin-antitoxin system antitoxin component (TIGR02293 family)|uniref:type II RES/Xre toxin-antitoxin system antitoxin n=1 Tax=Sphaerotilus sp. TaxID=2093942 RepID=UPI0025F44E87|nr:antitoxin Xre/MbcA/ParS toxin-binding domain-containing protein [Sphaerotilus sp.]